MRESDFIRQNLQKWKEFETLFNNVRSEPRRLTELYVQITDDLSYARTFYPNRSVRAYLNLLSQRVFQRIYRNRRETMRSWLEFWTLQLPRELWTARLDLLISLLVFAGALSIGLLSSIHDPGFAELILGQDYVDMTRRNIAAGDPMQVYKDSAPGMMFLRIALNNLFVDLLTFTLGIVYAIGTLFVMVYNGIMVGTFQYFFVEFGLLGESALTIWQHGTLEMSAMVIAGAAGLTMGRGLAFPGTYSRGQAFRLSAVRGFRIMVPVLVMTLFAALIESWVTRHTQIPDIIRLMVIIGSLVLVLGYVVWYPRRLAARGLFSTSVIQTLPARAVPEIHLDQVRTAGELFTTAFLHVGYFWRPLLRGVIAGACALAFAGALLKQHISPDVLILDVPMASEDPFDFLLNIPAYLGLTAQFSNYGSAPWLVPINLAGFYLLLLVVFRAFEKYPGLPEVDSGRRRHRLNRGLCVMGALGIGQLVLFLAPGWGRLLFILILPLMVFWACSIWWEKTSFVAGLSRAIHLVRVDWPTLTGAYFSMALLGLVAVSLINSPLIGFYTEVLQANLALSKSIAEKMPAALIVFQAYTAFFLMVPLAFSVLVAYYFHARELDESHGMKNRIEMFGKSRNSRMG